MPQSLGDVTLSGSTGTDDQDADLFFNKTAGSQIGDERAVETGNECKIELLKGF